MYVSSPSVCFLTSRARNCTPAAQGKPDRKRNIIHTAFLAKKLNTWNDILNDGVPSFNYEGKERPQQIVINIKCG